ncbi:MAG: hypothetical protein M3384_11585 [Acidobacteriota bacterium]|nr:hypothetical protein [Acidobacteriota bacterium]
MFLRQSLPALFHGSAIALLLFRKSADFDKYSETGERTKNRSGTDFSRIRCPLCRWQPRASSRWCCVADGGYPHFFYGGCGAVWNTFETRGLCPGCNHQWTWTDCLRCWQSSPHEAWYETDETD